MGKEQSDKPTDTPADDGAQAQDDFAAEQAAEIEGIMDHVDGKAAADDADAGSAAEPDDKPLTDKPADDSQAAAADDQTPEDQTPADSEQQSLPEDAQAAEGQKEAEGADKSPTDTAKAKAETFEVITKDGVKQVPVENLVTTYQQHADLQRRHLTLKPVLDLLDSVKLPVEQLMPFLELGITTAHERQSAPAKPAATAAADPAQPQAKPVVPGEYDGPFTDQAKDDYYKSVDPDYHATMWNTWNRTKNAGGTDVLQRLERIEGAITRRETDAQNEAQAKAQADMTQKGQAEIESRILGWAGDKKDYFSNPKVGKERTEAFKNFLFERYPESRIKDLTPEFLSAVFASFDPQYYTAYMTKLVSSKSADDSRLFAEGQNSVRGDSSPQLTEQQEHMADMLDIL